MRNSSSRKPLETFRGNIPEAIGYQTILHKADCLRRTATQKRGIFGSTHKQAQTP
jgi:hypothetical protein